MFAFEATSALLITAGLGAMVLAHREPTEPKRTQLQRMKARAAVGGKGVGPLPGPGIYADHDAVDTPALLPDGSIAATSVPEYLQVSAARPHVDTAEKGARTMRVDYYLYLSAVLFTIGAVGVLVRRNAIVVFMCVELMLNAVNLTLVTFARINGNLDGQVIAFFVMVVAAAEVVVGLAIIMSIFRSRRSASVDDANLLKY